MFKFQLKIADLFLAASTTEKLSNCDTNTIFGGATIPVGPGQLEVGIRPVPGGKEITEYPPIAIISDPLGIPNPKHLRGRELVQRRLAELFGPITT